MQYIIVTNSKKEPAIKTNSKKIEIFRIILGSINPSVPKSINFGVDQSIYYIVIVSVSNQRKYFFNFLNK